MVDETQATTPMNTFTQLEDLEKGIEELQMQKNEILRAWERARAQVDELIEENLVIAFVDELEKAHQYYAFKHSLKQSPDIKADSTAGRIYNTIAESQVLIEQSKKLDHKVIQTAINEYIFEMKEEQEIRSGYSYVKCLTGCESITSQSDIAQDMDAVCHVADTFPGLNDDKKEYRLRNYKMCLASSLASKEDTVTKFKEKIEKERDRALAKLKEHYDYYASANAIYGLVFKARQSKYIMDEDPKKELQQIMIHPSMHYILEARFKKMMISSHTRVLLRWISCEATEDDVKGVFSGCGMIECIEFKRVKKENVAFVTYKDPDGAHRACLLKGPKLCKRDVCVVRAFNYNPPSGDVFDAGEPTLEEVEKFIRSMHDKALEKYKHLRSVDTIVEARSIITGTLDKEKDSELVERQRCLADKSGTLDNQKDSEAENKPSRKRKMPSRNHGTRMQLWMRIMLWCCWFGGLLWVFSNSLIW